jgi:phosphoglucomutase
MRLTEADGTELFAGIRVWITATEVGIKMNDGNGGPAETLIFTQQRHISAISQFVALARRKGRIRRFQHLRRYAAHNLQEIAQ